MSEMSLGMNSASTPMQDVPPKLGLAYVAELTSMQLGEKKFINGKLYTRLPNGWLIDGVLIPNFGTDDD